MCGPALMESPCIQTPHTYLEAGPLHGGQGAGDRNRVVEDKVNARADVGLGVLVGQLFITISLWVSSGLQRNNTASEEEESEEEKTRGREQRKKRRVRKSGSRGREDRSLGLLRSIRSLETSKQGLWPTWVWMHVMHRPRMVSSSIWEHIPHALRGINGEDNAGGSKRTTGQSMIKQRQAAPCAQLTSGSLRCFRHKDPQRCSQSKR
jgi:hypothetical protein